MPGKRFCAVPNCENSKQPGIIMHKVPPISELARRKLWSDLLNLSIPMSGQEGRGRRPSVCSNHFADDSYIKKNGS